MHNTRNEILFTNIQNTAYMLASRIGVKYVSLYLQQHYGTSRLEQIAQSDYDRVFDDLDSWLNDLK